MADSPLEGMLGVEDFVNDANPGNWRAGLFRQQPSGTVPLTALTALMPERQVDDEKFHWWRKDLPTMRASVTGVYTKADLSTAYTSGGVSGEELYIKIAAADVGNFKADQVVLLRSTDDASVDVTSLIIGEPVSNGASSYIPVQLLEADDNSLRDPAMNLSDCDTAQIIGTAHEDGSLHPKAIAYAENEVWNYTQIFRDTLNLTGRRRATRTRTVDPYDEAKLDAMMLHSMGMERSFIWGERTRSITGTANGQPRTMMRGIVNQIVAGASDNRVYYDLSTDDRYKGKAWTDMGLDWLEAQMELSFRYNGGGGVGSNENKLVYCGNQALLGIQRAVRANSNLQIEVGLMEYGIMVSKLHSAWGTWNLQRHPLFSSDPVATNQMLVLEPVDLTYVYFQGRDTQYIPQADKKWGLLGYDGVLEGYFTDCSIELNYPSQHMYLGGVGIDNSVA